MERSAAPGSLTRVGPGHTTLTGATVNSLRSAIETGIFEYNSQLPSEQELMEMLGVSRTTLREALKSLEEFGLIVRRRGLGTFVCEKSIVKDLSANFGITEMIKQAGLEPGSESISIRTEVASVPMASNLALPEGASVFVIDRVRTANQKPAVWSLDYVSTDLLDLSTLESAIYGADSLYSFLYEKMKLGITRGMAQLRPIVASAAIAEKLRIRRGSPLMMITQTDYLVSNRPMLYSVEYHLPDLFLFMVNRKGPQR